MADYNTESVLYNFNSMGYGEQSVKSGYVDFLEAIEAEPTYRPVWKRSNGFLSRYMIDSLASVKYAVLDKTETPPRGFEKIGENENYNIYRNNYSMPLGVVIDQTISIEDFEKLSIRQKDVALLNCIVSDDIQESNLTQYQNELNVESEEITLEEMYLEGITLAVKMICMKYNVNQRILIVFAFRQRICSGRRIMNILYLSRFILLQKIQFLYSGTREMSGNRKLFQLQKE